MLKEFLWDWVPWTYNNMMYLIDTSHLIYWSLYRELSMKKEWVLLKDNTIPLSSQQFTLNDISENTIRWRVTVTPPVFTDPRTKYKPPKHISYLGFSVNIPGLDTIDISDWINEVKWVGSKEPSPLDIFTLWCCKTSTPLFHILEYATVHLITESGETVVKGLNEFTRTIIQENVRVVTATEDSNRTLDAVLSSSGR
jgi:hypothetical protein